MREEGEGRETSCKGCGRGVQGVERGRGRGRERAWEERREGAWGGGGKREGEGSRSTCAERGSVVSESRQGFARAERRTKASPSSLSITRA